MKIYRKGEFNPVIIELQSMNEVAEFHEHIQRAKFFDEYDNIVKIISSKLFEIMEADKEIPRQRR